MIKQLMAVVALVTAVSCHTPSGTVAPAGDSPSEILNAAETRRIESVLASDEMQGRKPGTPGMEKATAFIEAEFRSAGLQTFDTLSGFRQEFQLLQPKHQSTTAQLNGSAVDASTVIVVTQQPEVNVTEASGYEVVRITGTQQLFQESRKFTSSGKNLVIVVDTLHRKNFQRLAGFRRASFPAKGTQVFLLAAEVPTSFAINSRHTVSNLSHANVVGVLPGRSLKNEYVIFSAHHDHLGTGRPVDGDSIYNGANDDAAGTTAVIMLAKYFARLNNNERTLVFVTFTAEESGGFGSQYFSRSLAADSIVAMFNIEMIGTQSKWGTGSAYITGFDKSDLGSMMQRNIEGTGFSFHPDPYPAQQLFYRSDNVTLAALGVPAHTISTAKMDQEPYYHSPNDELETLDLENMTAVIRAIARAAGSIISGKETPSRVKTE